MATRTISALGGSWDTLATWSEAAIPTAADDVVATALSGNLVGDGTGMACRSFVMTNYVGTFSGSNNLGVGDGTTGHFLLVAGMGYTYAGAITFKSTTTGNQITLAGKTLANVTFNGASGSWTLQDAWANTGFTLSQGTVNTNGQTLSTGAFTGDATTNTRALTLGSSVWTLNNASWSISDATGMTLTANTSTIVFNATSSTINFISGGLTYNNITYANGASKTQEFRLTIGVTTVISGTFTATGNSVINRPLIDTVTIGSVSTIQAAAVSLQDVDFRDITATGAATWSGTRVGNARGNTGFTFTTAKNVFWVGNGGSWSDSTNHWSLTSGGSPGVNNIPLPQDDCYFDDASFSSASQTVTNDMPRLGANISWAGFSAPSAGVISTYNGLAFASVKTIQGLAVASVKTVNGAAAQ